MHVFFAEKNKIKADEIAARQKFLAGIPPSPNLICGLQSVRQLWGRRFLSP